MPGNWATATICSSCLLVSKEGDLVFMRKGPLSDADKKEFYQVVQKYR